MPLKLRKFSAEKAAGWHSKFSFLDETAQVPMAAGPLRWRDDKQAQSARRLCEGLYLTVSDRLFCGLTLRSTTAIHCFR